MTRLCKLCGYVIKLKEQVYQLRLGDFRVCKDDGVLDFEEVKSVPVHGFVHFKCFRDKTR